LCKVTGGELFASVRRRPPPVETLIAELSACELEVLHLIGHSQDTRAIAGMLFNA
jgi:hypothetical protein